MNILLKIPIECGELTCASSPARFCPYVVSSGDKTECWLFRAWLIRKNGWLQRCDQCLFYEDEKQNEN